GAEVLVEPEPEEALAGGQRGVGAAGDGVDAAALVLVEEVGVGAGVLAGDALDEVDAGVVGHGRAGLGGAVGGVERGGEHAPAGHVGDGRGLVHGDCGGVGGARRGRQGVEEAGGGDAAAASAPRGGQVQPLERRLVGGGPVALVELHRD